MKFLMSLRAPAKQSRWIAASGVALLAMTAHAYAAAPITLEIPVRCEMGVECFIQNYPDEAVGKEAKDYRCGHLSYNKHDGTDFRLRNYVEMRNGVEVLAAAEGQVQNIRNDVDDVNYAKADKKKLKDKECGNGVVIKHENGWETQYCHMMKGSVVVMPGDKVQAGTVLGKIGLSGQTEFPHMHLSVRYKGQKVDPFTSQMIEKTCDDNQDLADSLWSDEAQKKLAYRPTTLLNFGMADTPPEAEKARDGEYDVVKINANSENIIPYVDIMGPQRGDVAVMQIIMPDGRVRHFSQTFTKPQALFFWYVGVKKPATNWQKGDYRVEISLIREDEVVFSDKRRFTIE